MDVLQQAQALLVRDLRDTTRDEGAGAGAGGDADADDVDATALAAVTRDLQHLFEL